MAYSRLGRSSDFRINPSCLCLPNRENQWLSQGFKSPVTAAGPSSIHTRFPVRLLCEHPDASWFLFGGGHNTPPFFCQEVFIHETAPRYVSGADDIDRPGTDDIVIACCSNNLRCRGFLCTKPRHRAGCSSERSGRQRRKRRGWHRHRQASGFSRGGQSPATSRNCQGRFLKHLRLLVKHRSIPP